MPHQNGGRRLRSGGIGAPIAGGIKGGDGGAREGLSARSKYSSGTAIRARPSLPGFRCHRRRRTRLRALSAPMPSAAASSA
jgi:hypothetical protein